MTSGTAIETQPSTAHAWELDGRVVRSVLSAALMIVAALCWWLALPPRGWWVLFPLGVAAFMGATVGHRLRDRIWLGGLCGLAHYSLALQWLSEFSIVGHLGAVLLEATLLAGVAAISLGHGPHRRRALWWLVTPSTLVLLEALQHRVPFGGFPLPSFGFSQVDGPFMAAAPVGGSLMVTGLAAVTGAAVLTVIVGPRRRTRAVASTIALLALLLPMSLADVTGGEPAGTLDAVIVQGGGPRGLREFNTVDATEEHLRTAELIGRSPDLVLMPESIGHAPGPVGRSTVGDRFARLAQELDTRLVAGVTETEADGYRNAAVLWGPDGQLEDRYEKHHRVPFGEYLPLRGVVEQVSEHAHLVPRDAIIGEDPSALRRDSTSPWGIVISYEVFFADRVREAVNHGGQVLLVPTSAASFATDEVPAIEVAASQMRAREFDRAVLQAAPTGYSAVIRPDGVVEQLSDLGTSELLTADVPLRTGLTPYARAGDTPMVALALAIILWSVAGRLADRSEPGRRPSQRARGAT